MSIFSKSKTVDSILSGVFAKIEELKAHSADQHTLADNDNAEAQRLQLQSDDRRKEAVRAELVANRIRRLIEQE